MPEDAPVKGNCSAIDEETDRKNEEHIFSELEAGNMWAWCTVKVRGKFHGVGADTYLGGCSYKNEKDFKD